MALDYHLNRVVRLTETTKFKALYKWAIQEFEGEDQIGPDYIPWGWTQAFTATQITYRQQYGLSERYWLSRRPKEGEPDPEVPKGFVEQDHIRAELRPGYIQDDTRCTTSFSMFGTKRLVGDISMLIYAVENEGDPERCVVRAGISYTTDVDFRDETSPDYLQFHATVSRDRFNRLKARVTTGNFNHAVLTVSGVRGLYSEWSPGISTHAIKVLTKAEDHKLNVPEGATIIPPTVKELDQFDLALITERKCQMPVVKSDEDERDGSYGIVDPVMEDRDRSDRLLIAVARLDDRAKKAQVALWIIAALLLLTLFK